MTPARMRYKGISFEHNPESLNISDRANVKEDNILFGEPEIYRTGRRCRVVTGRGQFAGEGCVSAYTGLLKLQLEGGSGILSLPEIKPFFAYFTRLELSCDPTPELVEYSFEFREDSSASDGSRTPYYHTGVQGENLWDISYSYGVDIDTLVKLNPNIRFINESLKNERVRIC